MRLKLRLIRKSRKAFDTAAIARLLRHEDEHGMGRIFMYAFINEVVRMKTPFPFDCESAQVLENDGGLLVIDNEDRSIALEHKRHQLNLSLDDKRTEGIKQIEYDGKNYREIILAWLAACIRYTSLQPELRKELTRYVQSIKRTTISESKKSNVQFAHCFLKPKIHHEHAFFCVSLKTYAVIWHKYILFLQQITQKQQTSCTTTDKPSKNLKAFLPTVNSGTTSQENGRCVLLWKRNSANWENSPTKAAT